MICPQAKTSPTIQRPTPTGRVVALLLWVKTKAKRNSFQALVTANRATAISAGSTRGSTTRMNA